MEEHSRIKLSLILPCYGHAFLLARKLAQLIDYLDSLGAAYEVIIVDDGKNSAEDLAVIEEFKQVRLLRNKFNLGKGASVRKGILASVGEYCVFMDADLPFEFEIIEEMLWNLSVKEFDFVIGDRNYVGSSYQQAQSALRRFVSSLSSFVIGRLIVANWFDTQCGVKGFRREVALDLMSVGRIKGFAFDVELIYIALKRGYEIKKLPVVAKEQKQSSVKILRDGLRFVLDLLLMRLRYSLGLYQAIKISRSVKPRNHWNSQEFHSYEKLKS